MWNPLPPVHGSSRAAWQIGHVVLSGEVSRIKRSRSIQAYRQRNALTLVACTIIEQWRFYGAGFGITAAPLERR